ncbi:MFS transporter [Subtercola lobariae]|uniref:MFS transporter n=1 Tax=Subtercola lobariae TaxID=1588641 RepID=A0A917B7V5_9MICO|nr:MFS transporter [Subtercola lobariae]GGF25194.1 putative MFS transporter [Subtercola lobariae]
MTTLAPRPLGAGRALALFGVLLVAVNLRTAVAALSPIFAAISVDVPLNSLSIGVLGTLPPLCFAVFGLLTPLFQRHLRLESLLLIALAAMVLGDVGRGLSGSYWMLAASSALTFAGMGTGNVLLPPLVKKYFPDRIGLVTSLYATVMALFSLLPPLIAVPLSDATNWRVSVSMWAVFSIIAVLPWIGLLVRDRRATPQASVTTVEGVIEEPDALIMGRAWHSGLAWALGIMFGITSLNVYAMFAWLPELLVDNSGVTEAQAGTLLALYASVGIPLSLVVPVLAVRLRSISVLVWLGALSYLIGDLGLLLVPATATWVWIIFAGLGPLLFPLSLVLINLRTRTQAGSVALSGFMQGVGYLIGAIGPLLVGVLHQLTGEWTLALVFLLATVPIILIAGLIVARPRMLEDGWHRGRPRTSPYT